MPEPKRSKEAKEQEFIDAIEQVIGAPLISWQRRLLLEFREAQIRGKKVTVDGRARSLHYG